MTPSGSRNWTCIHLKLWVTFREPRSCELFALAREAHVYKLSTNSEFCVQDSKRCVKVPALGWHAKPTTVAGLHLPMCPRQQFREHLHVSLLKSAAMWSGLSKLVRICVRTSTFSTTSFCKIKWRIGEILATQILSFGIKDPEPFYRYANIIFIRLRTGHTFN